MESQRSGAEMMMREFDGGKINDGDKNSNSNTIKFELPKNRSNVLALQNLTSSQELKKLQKTSNEPAVQQVPLNVMFLSNPQQLARCFR